MHVDIRQKPTQYCKATVLQLKIIFFLKNKKMIHIEKTIFKRNAVTTSYSQGSVSDTHRHRDPMSQGNRLASRSERSPRDRATAQERTQPESPNGTGIHRHLDTGDLSPADTRSQSCLSTAADVPYDDLDSDSSIPTVTLTHSRAAPTKTFVICAQMVVKTFTLTGTKSGCHQKLQCQDMVRRQPSMNLEEGSHQMLYLPAL